MVRMVVGGIDEVDMGIGIGIGIGISCVVEKCCVIERILEYIFIN